MTNGKPNDQEANPNTAAEELKFRKAKPPESTTDGMVDPRDLTRTRPVANDILKPKQPIDPEDI